MSWDHRGHGDSEHAELYSWDADLRDAVAVFDHVAGASGSPGDRALEGRGADDATRRRPPVPIRLVREHRRHPAPPADPRPRRARPHQDADQRAHRLARPPPVDGDRPPQAGDARRARPAAGSDEPAPVARMAAVPRQRRRDGVRRRLAVEARPDDAHGRLRSVAPGVGAGAPAGPGGAVPRRARRRTGGHGLGHPGAPRRAVPPDRRSARDARRHRTLRPHRAARPDGRDDHLA